MAAKARREVIEEHTTVRRLTKLGALLAIAVLTMVGFGSSPASAGSGTLWSTNGASYTTYNYGPSSRWMSGRAVDYRAGDAACTRVYVRGYNYVTGYGSWEHKATACAGGSAGWSEWFPASDKVYVKVCTGYSYCSTRQAGHVDVW